MDQNPIADISDKLKYAQLETSVKEMLAEMKVMSARLAAIEALLESNKDKPQTYIK